MEQCSVESLSEYVKVICEGKHKLEREHQNVFGYPQAILFRGQASTSYQLIPSLARPSINDSFASLLQEERNLIELARYKKPDIFCDNLQPIELLALLQHHGIPTRLLDVTESALVALYFACCSRQNDDGEVFVFKFIEKHVANYPVINAIADSYRFADTSIASLASFYRNVKVQTYFLEQKSNNDLLHETDDKGGEWIARCCKSPLFVYAQTRSLRQQVQRGRYILFPNHIEHETPVKHFLLSIDPIEKDDDCILMRITIPKKFKQQMLLDLELMGISKDVLFCDNIDMVCAGIVETCKRRAK